jgi:hypothetical protein
MCQPWLSTMATNAGDNAPANFTTIKHMALNLIRLKSSSKKDSLRVRRKVATWDDDYLASLVGG